jgi:L-fucose isomerase-like protein
MPGASTIKHVTLISNGDFRNAVGRSCWPKQEETLKQVERALSAWQCHSVRAHPYRPEKGHGFLNTQAEACAVFAGIPSDEPLILVLSSWVWAHHVASCLKLHKGPVLLLGNFDGTWPGLVSLLNHSASLERIGVPHSRLWTDSFDRDAAFMTKLRTWLEKGTIHHAQDHLSNLDLRHVSPAVRQLGDELAKDILRTKRILGQFDPGCMGMLNAVMSPDKLATIGMPLELLSQSDLLAEMALVSDQEAQQSLSWLRQKGVQFDWGQTEEGLTERQVLEQMKMYSAAGRMYSRYGLAAIGIPYQYGLVRITVASDLPEGMLNNSDRPEIRDPEKNAPINPGKPIVHFNEGDVGSAVPQVLMHDILARKGMAPETTLHDIRWGDAWEGAFVWSLEISGGAPPAHFGGWDKTSVYRQPAMYFPRGGGTCAGVGAAGTVTWARYYESFGEIGMDIGLGETLTLPRGELVRRQNATNKEWPISNVRFPGYGRDELMSTHRSNHVTICYGDIVQELGAAAAALGIPVRVAGDARERFSSRSRP